jgi:hypothetical protein
VQDGRRVVPGVAARLRRLLSDGLAQIAVAIAAAHALVDRLRECASDQMYVLADLGEHDGEAGVLADRHAVARRDVGVLHELAEDLAPYGRLLSRAGRDECVVHVARQVVVGRDAQLAHGRGDVLDGEVPDLAHVRTPSCARSPA